MNILCFFSQETIIRALRNNHKRFDDIFTEIEKMVGKSGQQKGERGAISGLQVLTSKIMSFVI